MSGREGIFFLTSLFFHLSYGLPRVDPLVETNVGLIRGVQALDGDYSMFMGIPYANIDKRNPFATSTPYPPFKDIFIADDDSSRCPQIQAMNSTIVGKADCLHLNVYVPNIATSINRLPVMVWIHGGGFIQGTGATELFGPKFLVRHDIILVTLNYRVGIYGFMCLDTPEVPGNQGLKDQRLALRWIMNNIEAFGGDVNKITIAGSSAGGKSVDFHVHLAKDMKFQGAIMQSGTILLPHLEIESNPRAPVILAELLGYTTSDVTEALSFLSAAEPHDVIAAGRGIEDQFVPCYEREFEGVESFLTTYSVNLEPANVKDMNIMLGFVTEEWLSRHYHRTDADYASWNGFRSELEYYFSFEENELMEMSDMMRRFYIGDEPIGERVKDGLVDFESDFLFNYPCERTIEKFIEYGARNIYYYLFSYIGVRNYARFRRGFNVGGATHGDENGYLFDTEHLPEQISDADQLMLDRMTSMWANFVKYGDPTPSITDLVPLKWEPITSKDSPYYYLDLNSNLTLGRKPFYDRMSFWELFYKRNLKLQRGYSDR